MTALRYAKSEFNLTITGTQLQQKKLAEMITEITKAQLLTWRLGVLKKGERDNCSNLYGQKQCVTWQLTLHVKQDKY
jgi:alkylation response protein AidB-like acyl-CoA dehydrogenase